MKRLFYCVFVTLFFSLSAFAQTEGINFQGLARNAAGEVLVSQQISLRLSVLLGSESGAVAYVETRLATTNPQGIFSLVVGDGNAISKTGNFSSIEWGTASKFIKVEMDPNAGNNFLMMGTTRMQAVPFAFHAYGVDAANVKGVLPLGSGGTGVASISELKASMGVDQINNTSDASKPISTATQAALNTKANDADVTSSLATKANASDVTTSLATKVDKVTGKELSTNDYTTAEKTKLAAITGTNTGDQDLSGYATTTQLATKANASDVTTSLATKVDKVTGKELSTNDYTTAEKTKLAAITGTNTGDQDLSGYATTTQLATKANTADVTTSLATKVDKVTGKELSTNDYTTAEKTKLAAITGTNTGDQVNITGNAGTATKLQNARTINGIAFDGSVDITLPAVAAGIPYTGATQAVNLGLFDLTVNEIKVGKGGGNKAFNTAIGSGALFSNTGGNNNTAIGASALFSNTEGGGNIAIGGDALALNTSGLSNTAIGGGALSTNVTGEFNTAIGYLANVGSGGLTNTTAIGNGAIVTTNNTIQLGNTAVTDVKTSGNLTVNGITVGLGGGNVVSRNTAIGSGALQNNSSNANGADGGLNNTAIGSGALSTNTVGDENTASGYRALRFNINGRFNTASGSSALINNTSGDYNTAFGLSALQTNGTGSNNTAIGNGADVASGDLTNATAIGSGAVVLDNNTIQLGNTNVLNVKTSGGITAGGKIIAGASSAASSSAVLEANSTTQGFLPPRLTTTQRNAIASPAEGLTLWNTTNKQLEVFDGSVWVNMNGELVSTLTVGQSYGGGKVAYIFTVNDLGYVANEQHGLIAATSDQSTGVPWSEGGFSPNPQTISTGARGTALGTGLSNTNTIIGAVGPSTSYAVGLARAHNGGGYTDWYLPSKDELYKLYLNKSAIGGFSGTYWSSTEYDQYDARFLEFGIGTQDYNTKHLNSFKVRAVRTF